MPYLVRLHRPDYRLPRESEAKFGKGDAAAPDVSLAFLLAGAAFLLPMILGYTIWAYWVFRGKVGTHEYH